MMFRKHIRNNRGFTLTELMIVIVIIGILAAIAIPKFRTVTTRAKLVEFKPILEQIYALEENYYAENDTYGSLDDIGFDDPKAKYFSFSVEADSTSFIASATCISNIKGKNKQSLKGMRATLDQDEEHGGDTGIRRIARW